MFIIFKSSSKNSTFCLFSVENCRTAILLAKEHLNIPRVISPEDFASEALDELSAMTYLSYFVRSESPGYYDTLNWVCKQLRTTQITNLTVRKSVFSRKYQALSVTRKIALKSNATLTPTWSLLFQIFFSVDRLEWRIQPVLYCVINGRGDPGLAKYRQRR